MSVRGGDMAANIGDVTLAPPMEFSELPLPLQTSVLALGGAPFQTCQAAAAVAASPDLTATWLTTTHPHPLERAAEAGKWDVCAHLLTRLCAQPPAQKPSLVTALSLAAHFGPVDLVSRLIAEGAWAEVCGAKHSREFRLNSQRVVMDKHGQLGSLHVAHPLVHAVASNRADVVALLLQQPGEPLPAPPARELLCIAARAGSIPIMQLLITYVPGISQPDIGGNPLASAALGGHIPALQFLLQHGAHPQNMRGTPFSSEHAFCPLRDAILHRARSPEVIQFMVDQGICWEGWSKALAAACTCGDAQLVQLLLSKAWEEPPPPGHPAGHIWCNLYSAARHRNTSVMRVLLEAGMHPANIAAAFCESAARGNVEGLALLHQYGAQIDCVDRSSRYARTALQSALSCKRTAAVQWLLQKKATVTTSALCAAVLRGAPSQVKLLMSHGACDPDSRAIAIAAQMGLADMVQVLLDARLSAAPHQAAAAAAVEVPMCAAASCGQVKMVRSLLNYLSAASATAASQRVTGPGAADRGSTRGHSAGNQASSSCSSSTSTPSVPQVLHRAMEAAAAGQRYCLVHSHLEQYDDRKQCQHGCQWREVARGFQQLSNHGESDDDDYDEDDDRPPRQPRKEFQKVTELLIAAGADPTYDGCRFLLRAIEVNNTTMIDTLLPLCAQHPAVVSGAALHWAIQAGSLHGVLQLRALKKTGQ